MKNTIKAAIVFFILFGFSPARAMPPGFPPVMDDQELRDLSSEAMSLALIHDLALTSDQRKEIKQILKPIRSEFEIMDDTERTFRDEHIKPRLKQVISDLKAGKDPTPFEEGDGAHMEALRSQMAALFVKADQAYEEITMRLSQEQRKRLEGFRFENYIGPTHVMHPHKLLRMEPMKLIQEIRGYSEEEMDRMVQAIARREEAHADFEREGAGDERREQKVRMLIDFMKKIHAMPQSEFEAKQELLKQELEALSPSPRGPGKDRGEGHPPPPPNRRKGFDAKRIVFSETFYESL